MLFRTSREVLDVPPILPDPTVPHLAAFYLALTRSAAEASPFLRSPLPNCDRKNFEASVPDAAYVIGSLQSICRVVAPHVLAGRQMDAARWAWRERLQCLFPADERSRTTTRNAPRLHL